MTYMKYLRNDEIERTEKKTADKWMAKKSKGQTNRQRRRQTVKQTNREEDKRKHIPDIQQRNELT